VWVDLHRLPARLESPGTRRDLERLEIELYEGLVLNVWDADGNEAGERDDLIATGRVYWDAPGQRWLLAVVGSFRHQSDDDPGG